MHEREKLTHGSCPPCGVGGAEPSSHSPGQDDGSRKAWRQGLLSWLLCHRVQSCQVRAELCNSQCGACSKLGGVLSPHCLNLEWDQIRPMDKWIRPMEPASVAWPYWSRTERAGACLSFPLKRSGEAGWVNLVTWLPQMYSQVSNPFSLGPCAWPAITLEEICLSVFFPLTVHAPSKCSCNISLHAASTIKKHDLVEKILTFLGSACPAAV